MTSSQSPRKIFVLAHRLAKTRLPDHGSKFSRRDFTLPQLFACLVLRQFYNLSYRRAEALLADAPSWRRAIGLKRAPDHNTMCDAFATLTAEPVVAALLDELAAAFEGEGLLDLENKPLAIDSTAFESRHVSRHYEQRRKRQDRKKSGVPRAKEDVLADKRNTVLAIPKLAIAVVCSCHLVLSAWTTTGLCDDHSHFEPVLFDAWCRADVRSVVADAGYDSERAHRLARNDMALGECLIPATTGRPSDAEPAGFYRRQMREAFAGGSPWPYGQRWQVETVNSMMKRNYGSALRAATPDRREREMMLKVLTHNIAL